MWGASDEFAVNIALIEDKEPVLGAIYIPAKELLYYAGNAWGSWIYRNSARLGQRTSSLTYDEPALKNGGFVMGFR